jgi:hypothetical protein
VNPAEPYSWLPSVKSSHGQKIPEFLKPQGASKSLQHCKKLLMFLCILIVSSAPAENLKERFALLQIRFQKEAEKIKKWKNLAEAEMRKKVDCVFHDQDAVIISFVISEEAVGGSKSHHRILAKERTQLASKWNILIEPCFRVSM